MEVQVGVDQEEVVVREGVGLQKGGLEDVVSVEEAGESGRVQRQEVAARG